MSNITDEDLNTKPNLTTEKYNFELTGLKDPVDVRKPSRNFLKIENLFSKIFSRKIKTGPGLQGEGDLENDLTLSIKSNDLVINISQENGITLNKTDSTENDNNKLFTALGALNLKNWLVTNYTTLMNNIRETLDNKIGTKLNHGGYAGTGQTLFNLIESAKTSLTSLINGKENSFIKNGAFNKNFGTELGTVLEGAKLAEALGLEYAGIVNNNNAKVAGKAYYCTSNKAIYKCTQNNSLNYIDANFFEGLSNDKLLGKLQNLAYYATDSFSGTTNGITYRITVSRNMFSCDIHIIAQGQVQQTDPIIIILPEIYRPYLIHRIKGYGANPDWIVRPDGIVQTSGGIGENKANNEIGYSYSVKMI